jgi:hypothetical protein
MSEVSPLLQFWSRALAYSEANPQYKSEMKWAEALSLDRCTQDQFNVEYLWAVVHAGMNNDVTRKIFDRMMAGDTVHPEVIKHLGKRKAINEALRVDTEGMTNLEYWFSRVKELSTDILRIEFLDSLPFIGPVTKYHLAQNIGIDVSKPDRHLERLRIKFGYGTAQALCQEIASQSHLRIRTVDLVIWRWCADHPGYDRSNSSSEEYLLGNSGLA